MKKGGALCTQTKIGTVQSYVSGFSTPLSLCPRLRGANKSRSDGSTSVRASLCLTHDCLRDHNSSYCNLCSAALTSTLLLSLYLPPTSHQLRMIGASEVCPISDVVPFHCGRVQSDCDLPNIPFSRLLRLTICPSAAGCG